MHALRVLVALAAALSLTASARAASPRLLTATVQRVADGDTVIAETSNGIRLRMQLLGIDAPEVAHSERPGQPFGKEARGYLEALVGGKTVRVEAYGRDQHKRVLVILWRNGYNVNLEMVRAGYAEVYRGAPCQVYCGELTEAEWEARREGVGMWSQPKPERAQGSSAGARLQGE